MRSFQHAHALRTSAQTLAEYALILALIAILAIAALKILGPAIADVLGLTASAIK